MKPLVTVALVAACLTTTTACASEQEQWCGHVKDAAPTLGKALDEGGAKQGLVEALPTLHDLADAAPGDVRGEWRTLVGAVDDLDEALKAHDTKATHQAALKLASPDVRHAADTVEQEARDVCHTALF